LGLLSKYGPNIRLIGDILQNAAREDSYREDITAAARYCADRFPDILNKLNDLDFGSKVPSKIFAVRPCSPGSRLSILTIPTHFLAGTLGIALSRNFAANRLSAFRMLDEHSTLHNAAGWIFEIHAHAVLSDPTRDHLPTYIRDNLMPHHLPPPQRFISGLHALRTTGGPFNFYWRPQEPNFPGLDALIRVNNVVWGLQYMIGKTHREATDGLTKAHDIMNHNTGVQWCLVILGATQSDAEHVRDHGTMLTGKWAAVPVYVGEIAIGNVTEPQLQDVINKVSKTTITHKPGINLRIDLWAGG